MQARHRSSGDGFRSGSGYRNFSRGGFSRAHPKSYPSPQPRRKADIFMDAGRLAAEYLVSKGLLPPNSLPGKLPNGRFQEFKGQDREPPMLEGRTSALARLGNTVPDLGHGRRRYHDEYNHNGSRSYSRGRKRNGPYGRGYGTEWVRENGRKGPWRERSREYADTVEGEDDFASGYQRVRRGGFDEVASSASRVGADERVSKSEFMGESGPEVENHEMGDDTGSKASSPCTRKDPPLEADADADESKVLGDVKVSNSEIGDEVKSYPSGDLKEKDVPEEEMDVEPSAVEGDPVNKHSDLLKLCSFASLPTKRRSSLSQRSPKFNQDPHPRTSDTAGVSKVTAVEDPINGSSSDSHTDQTNTWKCQAPDISSTLPDQPMEESVDPQNESGQCPPGFRASRMPVDMREEVSFTQDIDRMEGAKMQGDSSSSMLSEENEYSLQNLRVKKSSPCAERLPTDEEMVEAVDQEKPVGADGVEFPKDEPDFYDKLEEEKQLLPTSFKICDLNLIGTPEVTEIADDLVLNHLHTSTPVIATGKELPGDVGLSIGNSNNDTGNYSRLSCDDKVVPVIDLEDDSPIEENACDSSKLKSETIYSSLDNFLSQTENADIPEIQDGYSLAFSEFLGTDIPGCPSVQADLNNLPTGMSLHDAQGVPGNDDSIYVSLGEIPIGFMDVWDQTPQEYEKFF